MSDIFREVEEDLRREQMRGLWARFGPYVVAVAVLIVLGVAGWRGWEWYQARQAAAAGEAYEEAVQLSEAGEAEAAREAFAEIAEGGGAYSGLARLREAELAAEGADAAAAAETFDAIANDTSVDPALRDVARIRAAYLLVDTVPPEEIEARVGGLAEEGNNWRHSAREVLALAAYRAGDAETASEHLEHLISDQEAPQDLRVRAQLLMALVGADRPATASAPAEPAPPAPRPVVPDTAIDPLQVPRAPEDPFAQQPSQGEAEPSAAQPQQTPDVDAPAQAPADEAAPQDSAEETPVSPQGEAEQ